MIRKYEVEGKPMGRCGSMIMITAKDFNYPEWGYNSLIADRGFKKGDIIEIYTDLKHNEVLVKRNGEVIYIRDEQKEKETHDIYTRELLQSKGIKHPVYNP